MTVVLCVLMLFTHVRVFASPQEDILSARTKMIQFAADHFMYAVHSYFWHLTIQREAGLNVDPYEYALARNYFNNNESTAYRPHFIKPLFKFVKESEFKVTDIEPDRLAIRVPNGKILWNAEKLSTVPEFTVFDAMKFLLHELNHSFSHVDLRTKNSTTSIELRPTGVKPSQKSTVAQELGQQKFFTPQFSSMVPISLSQKDKFVSNFVEFLKSRTQMAQDVEGVNKFSALNLVLTKNKSEQSQIFDMSVGGQYYVIGLIGWSEVGLQEFNDESKKLAVLYESYGRTKLVNQPVAYSFDDYSVALRGYSASLQPEIQIQSMTVSSDGKVQVNFSTLQHPTFVNDSRLRAFEHMDRQPLPNLAPSRQEAKATFSLGGYDADTDSEKIFEASSLDFSYKFNLAKAEFSLVKVIDQKSDRFLTFDITGAEVDLKNLKRPILVCIDSQNQKYTLIANQVLKKGHTLRAVFKTKYLGRLTVTEIVWPGYESKLKSEYVENVIRAKKLISIEPSATYKPLGGAFLRDVRVDDIRFDLDGQLSLRISGNPNDLARIDSLLIELGHIRNYEVRSMQVDGRNPYWKKQIGEKISISNLILKKYLKSENPTSFEFLIPINQLSQLTHHLNIDENLQLSDSMGRVVSGLWVTTKDNALFKIPLEKEPLYEKETADFQKQKNKLNRPKMCRDLF